MKSPRIISFKIFICILFSCFFIGCAQEDDTSDGASNPLDPDFGVDGIINADIHAWDWDAKSIAIQGDGRIVLAGYVNDSFLVVRLNTDQSLDSAFGSDGIVSTKISPTNYTDKAYAVAIQPDGKILVAGYTDPVDWYKIALVRYNADGSLDTGFGTNGIVITCQESTPWAGKTMALQADGKIVVAGTSYAWSGGGIYSYGIIVVRFNADGSLDTTFSSDGWISTGVDYRLQVTDMVIDPSGGIVIAGATNNNFLLVRYDANGNFDTGFGTNGLVLTDFEGKDRSCAVEIDHNGKIIAAGYGGVSSNEFALARYNANGSIDTGFGASGKVLTDIGGLNEAVGICGLDIDSENRIVVSGTSANDFALARYDENGNIDTSFGTAGIVITDIDGNNDIANCFIIAPDGRMIAGGTTTAVMEYCHLALVAYLP